MKKFMIAVVGMMIFGSVEAGQVCMEWRQRCNYMSSPFGCWQECVRWGNVEVAPPSVIELPQVEESMVEQGGNEVQSYDVGSAGKRQNWVKRNQNEIIIGAAVSAAFVGVMVYTFGFEQSDNNPGHVKLATF